MIECKVNEKMQRNIRRILTLILSIIMVMTLLPLTASAAGSDENVIRVGSFEETYNVVDKNGVRRGYGYEYLQTISGYSGWSYQYINSSWEECFNDLEKGKLDVLGGISYTDERAEKMLFSAMPMGEERYYIYTDVSNSNLSSGRISSFEGKNIGVLKDYIPEDVLNEWEIDNGLTMHHVNISSVDEILNKMKRNEIDCFVSVEDSIWKEHGISPVTGIGESSIYFAIRKDRPDIKNDLDYAMRRIKDDNPFYTDELYQSYLSTQRSPLVSKDEKNWIAKHGAIKIGYLNDDTGVSVVDPETGKLTGVITDYVNLAKNSLQGQTLEFELEGYDTRARQLKALQNGEIDFAFHVSQNPYVAESNGYVLSDTVWTFNIAAITSKHEFDENSENTVAVTRDNFALKAYVTFNYPNWKIKECRTQAATVRAVKDGEADCILCNSGVVSEYLSNKNLHSFFLTKPADASFAVKKADPVLLSIVNKTLTAVPTSKFSGAVVSYSSAMQKATLADFCRDNMWFVFAFLILIVAVIGIFLIRSIVSGRKAKALNEELNVQKSKLEDALADVLDAGRLIDKQKKNEMRYQEKLSFNNRVLSGLSADYTIAIVLNLDTDEYEIAFAQITNHAKKNNEISRFGEYVDKYVQQFVLPEFKESMRSALSRETIKARFNTEDDYHFFFETVPNAAGYSCFQAHIVKEYDADGHFAFLGFSSVDEAVGQERKYKKMIQNQLDLITSSLPGGVKISNDDSNYSFKYVSDQFAQMLGYDSPEEMNNACGGTIVGLVHPDDVENGIADALNQYSHSNNYATTYRVRCKDGSYKYVEDRGQKVINADGEMEHWNLILDKNELMEKNIALESEKKANQSKSSFLARMSHDMRTPLNGIIGLIKINQDHFDDVELVRANYRKMEIAAEHLQSLVNDVLQMSKIEDGSVRLTKEVINFRKLSDEIVAMLENKVSECGISLEFKAAKDYELYPDVYGSPLHIKQIFLNIYGNCIKFNHEGGKISTVADFEIDENGRCVYKWSITDTGIGMSEEFVRRIFEPFAQEKDDARSVYQGVGLGMPIVKGLIDKMCGTITVDSKEGVGSTFNVSIPFEIYEGTNQKSLKEEQEADIRGLKLLLAEDNELNAEIARTILEDEGAEITIAGDGLEAVNTFKDNEPGTFDAILMDIMMPKMNGYEATRAIRSLERPDAKTIPIIAMTANAFAEDAKKCMGAGMNAHLGKPINVNKLISTISRFTRYGEM